MGGKVCFDFNICPDMCHFWSSILSWGSVYPSVFNFFLAKKTFLAFLVFHVCWQWIRKGFFFFFLIWKCLYLSIILKCIFAKYRCLGGHVFFFLFSLNILNLFHCLLMFPVSDEQKFKYSSVFKMFFPWLLLRFCLSLVCSTDCDALMVFVLFLFLFCFSHFCLEFSGLLKSINLYLSTITTLFSILCSILFVWNSN